MGQNSDNKFYTIPGIDYISHEDVLPYEHSESIRDPIQHNLFQKFLEKKNDRSTTDLEFDCLSAYTYTFLQLAHTICGMNQLNSIDLLIN